jgi:hypothetical protein
LLSAPRDPSDAGSADPRLAAALAAWRRGRQEPARAEVHAALLGARVLVALAPVPVVDPEGGRPRVEVAMVTMAHRDGRKALPVFSSVATLSRWRADARPVPVPGDRALSLAAEEGFDALLLDPAGTSFVVAGSDLDELAAGFVPMPNSQPGTSGGISAKVLNDSTFTAGVGEPPVALVSILRAERDIEAAWWLSVEGQSVLGLLPRPGCDLSAVVMRLAEAAHEPVGVLPLTGDARRLAAEVGIRLR